ncbi:MULTISPECIES: MoaD/ThiS family protein [Chryseobacterium]|uniref:Molybdopterin synthase sulfur carrier subunit n=1 Tax=Chryseobacterium camelliae TaxID=1265445 RepID=A0ABU0TIC9_9FLAO|nr:MULTISPECIES: MoaD/ThiS family protein [Chryseobacterium]MDT3406289.1 molybdopterin synthase sulfur carrier subunit [Pseudacidovorax intermedius]MDQ1095913.1 molybdopterin synthase sulfur carrier subunit [Chryseobacterium camelliae]MDQ1099849.1 molybdopterin synthase sulfur carrier subunit [Chryseobacterium sp. SORGH_AS_1048]MDR6087195.1 molybdopterin synthase sulfur carrier subunit [Chryseobacterium sp. SORGH_AS_0909]MDR6131568.1 molybdopterin synthase sulfur carrier subunit [Chryseobacter
MEIRIIAFGQIAEITGKELLLDAVDISALKKELKERFPELEYKKFAVAVNKKITEENLALHEGDTIALMPPYSGG